jgi:ATP-dependent RNA helicase DHX57
MSYDPQNNMRKLNELWASRAAGKQRRGRAGRVQAGKCYKLFTRDTEMLKMAERPEPEIRRVPLEQLCLSVRAMGIRDVHQFLASVLTPPDGLVVDGALELLVRMGALDGNDLTALGCHLSMIPADLRCGKLMVYGAMFGCLDACVAIAAILTIKSPFIAPQDKREEAKAARSRFAGGHGDLIGDLRAFERWDSMVSFGRYAAQHLHNCSDLTCRPQI